MNDREIYDKKAITAYENDLLTLLTHLSHNSPNYQRIRLIIDVIRQIAFKLDSKDLYRQLYTSLTENNHCSTWFTNIVDRNCHQDPELKLRLHNFIQETIGPLIKLSEFVKDKRKSLAIEFPNREMRDIFLHRSKINSVQESSIVIDGNIVHLPAFQSENQQLGVSFPTVVLKDAFIRILNLDRAKLIVSNSHDCNLYINDRRIHDTSSRFHIAVICPYFAEYYKIQYASHMLAQAQRDPNSFFSQTKFPKELALKIASDISSSDAISMKEKLQIASDKFYRP
jgi:hypothetical protein